MEKNTKILLGLGAVIAFYLILKPKKASAQTSVVNTPKTKDCVVETYNCVTTRYETIQIPIDANCYEYQPDRPQCAEPMPDMSKFDITDSTLEKMNEYYAIMERLRESKNRDCATPMAIGYSSYFDEALGRCVTKYTKPTEEALIMAQSGVGLTNWA